MKQKFNTSWIFQKLGGACRAGYPAVVASGEAACSIHYIKATQVSSGEWEMVNQKVEFRNTQRLQKDEHVLMDAGCEYHGEHQVWMS